ncbi:MAG: DUF4190 domain-containing protein [Planctomycetota bacterium]|nr:DUF4190 domain-containing protein [Planctomycetota bacterium]
MSQYQSPFEQQTMEERPKTSGLAITALVMSLVAIIPCLGLLLAPIAVILGLIGAITVSGNPARKGTGLAVAGILIGALVFAGQVWGIYAFWDRFAGPVMRGPDAALEAGFNGDAGGFKSEFHGPGATADDATVIAFVDALRSRYGEYQSCALDQAASTQPSTGQPSQVFPYVLQFESGPVSAEAEMIFADQNTGTILMKWTYIEILDSEQGTLIYPPEEAVGEQPAGEDEGETTGDAAGDGG